MEVNISSKFVITNSNRMSSKLIIIQRLCAELEVESFAAQEKGYRYNDVDNDLSSEISNEGGKHFQVHF